MRYLMTRFVGLSLVVATTFACTSDDESSITGTTTATKTLTIGTAPASATLVGKGNKVAQVDFPVGITRVPIDITVNLNEGVRKRGAEVGGAVVEIVNPNLVFETTAPARMRQTLPPPPTGKQYKAVFAQKMGDTWTVLPNPPRVVGAQVGNPGEVDGSVVVAPGLAADAGADVVQTSQPQVVAQPEGPANATYEVDVTGSGYWAIAYEVEIQVAPSGACGQAVTKLKGCGYTFTPGDPCADVDAETECYINCINQATCQQINATFCSQVVPNPNDPIFQCYQACSASTETPCGDGEFYYADEKCDGFQGCANGADEVGCPQFACGDGTSIPQGAQCDGYPHCSNQSDEVGCAPQNGGSESDSGPVCPDGSKFGSSEGSTPGDPPTDVSPQL